MKTDAKSMTTARSFASRFGKTIALLPLLALTACAGSQRFSSPTASAPSYSQPLPPAPAISSAPVTSEPLPPPGGYPAAPPPATAGGALPPPQDPYYTPAPGMPPGQPPLAGQPGVPPAAAPSAPVAAGGQVAGLGPAPTASPPASSRPSGRDGLIGGWTAREATGGTCRVVLSSTPTLDLYRASASGCANRDLQKISAWDYRDGEVYLYQQGGTVAARLRSSGGGLDGAVTKSGASLSMNR